MLRLIVPALIVALAAAAPASAQGRAADGVPPGHRPPAGMCRIWIDGVPPGQQAAPTDCATAVRNRPANGRVLFGDENAKPGKSFKPKRLRDDDGDVKKEPKIETKKPDGDEGLKKAKVKKTPAAKPKDTKKKPNPNDI
jgi:hypothetical protein